MSSNLIVTLLGLLTVVAVTVNIQKSKNLVENWNLGYPIAPIGQSVLNTRAGLSAAPSNSSMYKNVGRRNRGMSLQAASEGFKHPRNYPQSKKNPDGFLTVPGNYQSPLSPRFSNTQYGANITYNLPQRKNLAVPRNPLNMANTVENYTPRASGGMERMSAQRGAGNRRPENDLLPTPDMDGSLVGPGPQNPILYHNLIYASKKSRTYQFGDPIRGDLPIVPCTDHKNRWFIPSANPSTALNTGAMNVMGGYDNTTAQQLGSLTAAANLGADLTAGGINVPSDLQGTAIGNMASNNGMSVALSETDSMMNQQRPMRLQGKQGQGPTGTIAVSAFPA